MTSDVELHAFWKRQVTVGSKVLGGLTGGIIGLASANPLLGAGIAPIVAQGLERVGTEMVDRKLAPRQEARVGRAIVVAALRVKERQDRGDVPREDGFFDIDPETGRSASDEISESALLAAMNSSQEKKVDFIALLLSNIAFNKSIDVSDGHLLIDLANSINYRAFTLMKIMNSIESFGFQERASDIVAGPPPSLHPIMSEVYGMARLGLVDMKDNRTDNNHYALLGVEEVDPQKLHLSPLGQMLYDNLELEKIPPEDPVYISSVEQIRSLSGYGKGPYQVDGGTF